MILKEHITEAYRNENVAAEAFKQYRLKTGVVCKKCGETRHYWLNSKHQFQCSACRFRTTLRSGTVLEGSKLPISYFFIAIHLIIKNGDRLTIEEFQQKTCHKYYDPLWDFLRKMKQFYKKENPDKMLPDFTEVVNTHFEFTPLSEN